MTRVAQSEPTGLRRLQEISAVLRAVRAVTRRCLQESIQGLMASMGAEWPCGWRRTGSALALPALRRVSAGWVPPQRLLQPPALHAGRRDRPGSSAPALPL